MAAAMKEQPQQGDVLLLLTKENEVYSHPVVDPLVWHDPDQLPHCVAWFRKTKVLWMRAGTLNHVVRAGDIVMDQDGVPIVITDEAAGQHVHDLPGISGLYRKVWEP